MIVGDAAHQLACRYNLQEEVPKDVLKGMHVTKKAKHNYDKYARMISGDETEMRQEANDMNDTVGCVVMKSDGTVVAGVSSGGIAMKQSGRVGEAAILGAGAWTYKQSRGEKRYSVGCSVTGVGERIMKHHIAKETCEDVFRFYDMEKQPCSMSNHCLEMISERMKMEPQPNDCGVILIASSLQDSCMEVELAACHHGSSSMAIGFHYVNGTGRSFHEEHILRAKKNDDGRFMELGIVWNL